jgi:hypothetical protein
MSNFFILRDEPRRESCINYLRAMNLNGRLLEVNIKPYKKSRSNAQNRLLWSWYNELEDVTGYKADDLHELLKVRFLGTEEKEIWGEKLTVAKSTTKLTTTEFTEYLEKVEMLANELNITLPKPADLYNEAMR